MAGTTEDRLSVVVPEDLKKKARKKAIDEGISLSEVIRRFLREWIGNNDNGGEDKKD